MFTYIISLWVFTCNVIFPHVILTLHSHYYVPILASIATVCTPLICCLDCLLYLLTNWSTQISGLIITPLSNLYQCCAQNTVHAIHKIKLCYICCEHLWFVYQWKWNLLPSLGIWRYFPSYNWKWLYNNKIKTICWRVFMATRTFYYYKVTNNRFIITTFI